MPNILFLPSWYPNRLYPQNGDFVQRHAVAVSAYCRVAVLYVLSDPQASRFEVETVWHQKVYEVRVYYPKTSRWRPYGKFKKYLQAHRLGYEAVLAEMGGIDLVHLNVLYKAGLFALELKRRYNLPFIVTEHWTAFLPISPVRFTPFERYAIRRIGKAAEVLCPVSHDLKRALQAFGLEGPYEVVSNVVDTDLFTNASRTAGSIKKILHISTLYDPHKNVSGLLEVMRRLTDKRGDFHLTIVGNHYVEKHRRRVQQLEMEKFVSIRGEIPHKEVATAMQKHDFFVLFSNYENLPCVISEAHASGLPVVATEVGGIGEMVDEGSGRLVAARDEDALLQQLEYMLDHLGDFDRETIRRQAVARYSYERVGARFLEIYNKVLTKDEL